MKVLLFGSIKSELLLISITTFTVVIIGAFITVGILITVPNTNDKIVAASNNIYVEVNRYIDRNDEEGKEYLKRLGQEYSMNIAIADLNGNIIMKSQNVNTNTINLEYIKNKILYTVPHEGDVMYQIYDIHIDGKTFKLITWNRLNVFSSRMKYMCILLITPISSILIIYFLTRRKTNYIKSISNGIVRISHGDLDYRIEKKGFDELSILSDEINNMSLNLKNRIEAEKSAEKLKRELITNVSHDLRTPLTALIGYLQLLKSDKISQENKERYIETSIEKVDKLKVLIDDLFEYSKLESGGIKLDKKIVNIVEIIEQCIGEVAILNREKKIDFKKQYKATNIKLKVDPDKISRVFQNILSNAIKYSTKESDLYIDIVQNNYSVVISFENLTDDLLNDHIERIFDRFYKVDESRNAKVEGSGLGLAISKSIVNLHSGEIWAENKNNKFKIYVKLINEHQ